MLNEHSVQAIAGKRVICLEREHFCPHYSTPRKSRASRNTVGAVAGTFPPRGMWGPGECSEAWLHPAERPKGHEGDVNLLKRGDPWSLFI